MVSLGSSIQSTHENRLQVNSINAGTINEVPRGIFTAVLNDAAQLVNFQTVNKNGQDVYFFTKQRIGQSTEDIRALHRLGPRVNLTTHDTQTDNTLTMDVKVHLDNTVINIRYGTNPNAEKTRMLRRTFKMLTRRAWVREKELVMMQQKLGGSGGSSGANSLIQLTTHSWDSSQRQQLLRKGVVEGFDVAFKRDVQKYPELANSLENIHFILRRRQIQRRKLGG